MKNFKLVLATAALAVSGAAIAGPSYTYVDGGLTVGDSQGNSQETEGYMLRGSFGFGGLFHVGGGYGMGDLNGGKSDTVSFGEDVSMYNIYFGVNPAVTEDIDLVARLGYSVMEFEGISSAVAYEDEVTGLTLEVGPRAMIGEKLELNAAVTAFVGEFKETSGCMTCEKDDLTEIGFRVGGEYYFTPAFSVGVDAEQNGIFGDQLNLHGRWSFGNN